MTDERIKEAYKRWEVNLNTVKNEELFADFMKCKHNDRPCVIGFYAGFHAAERLAKLEVLEPVLLMMDKLRFFSVADYKDAKDSIETMIAELKEEGE